LPKHALKNAVTITRLWFCLQCLHHHVASVYVPRLLYCCETESRELSSKEGFACVHCIVLSCWTLES